MLNRFLNPTIIIFPVQYILVFKFSIDFSLHFMPFLCYVYLLHHLCMYLYGIFKILQLCGT